MAAKASITSVVIHCTARNLTLDVSDGKSRLKTTISYVAVRVFAMLLRFTPKCILTDKM